MVFTHYFKEVNEWRTNYYVTYRYSIIETEISRVKPEMLYAPINSTPYIGINGGFFMPQSEDAYREPPLTQTSISYWNQDEYKVIYTSDSPSRTLDANYEWNGTETNPKSRKTFVSYDDGNGNIMGAYLYVKNLQEVYNHYPSDRVQAVIGGTDYNLSGAPSTLAYYAPTYRTVLAWDNSKGKAYYIVTDNRNVTIDELRSDVSSIGYDIYNSIVLDGSGSTKQRVYDDGMVKYYGSTENRYIGNMIRVYGAVYYG